MATCTGHAYKSTNNTWKAGVPKGASLKASLTNHAERLAYNDLEVSSCYLMLIDDFPCHSCHAYFLEQSRLGSSIIFKVTANAGAYSADHGLGLKSSVPCIIYYHLGTARYDSLGLRMEGTPNLGAHPGFPVHAAFENY